MPDNAVSFSRILTERRPFIKLFPCEVRRSSAVGD